MPSGYAAGLGQHPDQVPVAVADALGMPMDGAAATRDLRDRLISFLTQRRMLLLVDNCEHVVDAAAVLIDDILSRCGHPTVTRHQPRSARHT